MRRWGPVFSLPWDWGRVTGYSPDKILIYIQHVKCSVASSIHSVSSVLGNALRTLKGKNICWETQLLWNWSWSAAHIPWVHWSRAPCCGVNILMLSPLNKSNLGSQLLYLNISSRSEPGLGLGLHGAGDNINLETRRADMWRYVDHFIISGFWIICCDTNNPVNVLTVPPLPPPACWPCQDHLFTDSISTSQFTDNKLSIKTSFL